MGRAIVGLMRPLLTLLFILFCTSIAFAQTEFASIEAFRKSVLQGEDSVTIEASGDLNGDGLADWAGVVYRQKPDAPQTYQLYVLLHQPAGNYQLAQTSREGEIPGMGCCWVEDLRIERSSIYIQNNAKTAATMEAATHQFKLYQGAWRLVGIRIYYIEHQYDRDTDTDMNVLTGQVIVKTIKRNRTITTRRTRKFGVHLLKDFDFGNSFGME